MAVNVEAKLLVNATPRDVVTVGDFILGRPVDGVGGGGGGRASLTSQHDNAKPYHPETGHVEVEI